MTQMAKQQITQKYPFVVHNLLVVNDPNQLLSNNLSKIPVKQCQKQQNNLKIALYNNNTPPLLTTTKQSTLTYQLPPKSTITNNSLKFYKILTKVINNSPTIQQQS